jgi:hypothetical protein
MVDRYTKTVLTVIAAALLGLLVQGAAPNAAGLGWACGSAESSARHSAR